MPLGCWFDSNAVQLHPSPIGTCAESVAKDRSNADKFWVKVRRGEPVSTNLSGRLSDSLHGGFQPKNKAATAAQNNLPAPVLAEPLQASDVEPGNTTHTRSGEARESTKKHALRAETSQGLRRVETTGDSRGGQNFFSSSSVPSGTDSSEAMGVPLKEQGIRGIKEA